MSESNTGSAVQTLRRAVRGFRFTSPTDEATWIALVLTVVARELGLFTGPAPLFLMSGAAGVGKSALARITGLITIGTQPFTTSPTRDELEEQHLITDVASREVPLVCIDGVEGRWGSAALCSALVSDEWHSRRRGGRISEIWPLRTTWVATACREAPLSTDMQRRVARISLDEAEPSDLARFAREHRDDLKAAAITLLRHGTESAGPFPIEPWGLYDRWSAVVRRALLAAGLPDVLTPRAAARLASVVDESGNREDELMQALEAIGIEVGAVDEFGCLTCHESELAGRVEALRERVAGAEAKLAARPLAIPADVEAWIRERAADLTTSHECLLRALVFVCDEAEKRDENALVEAVERAMLRRELVSPERCAVSP